MTPTQPKQPIHNPAFQKLKPKYVIQFNGSVYLKDRIRDTGFRRVVMCTVTQDINEADTYASYTLASLIASGFIHKGQFKTFDIVRIS